MSDLRTTPGETTTHQAAAEAVTGAVSLVRSLEAADV